MNNEKYGEIASLAFGRCIVCGKEGAEVYVGDGISYHKSCFRCPKCGEEDFIAWNHSEKPYVARCLNCLERYLLGGN